MSTITQGGMFASGNFAMRGAEHFPDPFCDMASTRMPENMRDVLRVHLQQDGPLPRSDEKDHRAHPFTDLEVNSIESSREEKDKFRDFLEETIDYRAVLNQVSTDYACYGNSFTSLVIPFRRYLSCPRCYTEWPLKKVFWHAGIRLHVERLRLPRQMSQLGVRLQRCLAPHRSAQRRRV